ncbi:hypothetical protein [Actinocatenispora rupis]|uniref:Uncharacterized protein n=1 Tax=Actinocatenispora rupis TaxID=519421 RepID=A0A8J3NCL8_9ACTN|nr:hypothetical protein [Actinocatenispora rupis]GID12035.1 hypothetical protein Aru02nite_29240 [Actinocatenispora rupis]
MTDRGHDASPPVPAVLPVGPPGDDPEGWLRESARRLVALDGRTGGEQVADLAARTVALARDHLVRHRVARGSVARSRRAADTVRGIRCAAAELAQVAGWIHVDAERHAEATRLNRTALRLARAAGDRDTELLTLLVTTLHETQLGRATHTRTLVDATLRRGHLTPRVEAMFRVRSARAYAATGQAGAARAEFDRARGLLLDGGAAADPAWAWWIDEAEIAGHEGAAYLDLGDVAAAAAPLDRATRLDADGAPQYRMVVGAQLLVARLALRDWVDAGRVADRLLGSTTTGSARTGRVLRHAARLAVAGAPSSLGDRVVALARRYPVHVVERS